MQTSHRRRRPTLVVVGFALATMLACTGSTAGEGAPDPGPSQATTSTSTTRTGGGAAHTLATWWQPQLAWSHAKNAELPCNRVATILSPTLTATFFDEGGNMLGRGIEPFLAYTSHVLTAAKVCFDAMPTEKLVTETTAGDLVLTPLGEALAYFASVTGPLWQVTQALESELTRIQLAAPYLEPLKIRVRPILRSSAAFPLSGRDWPSKQHEDTVRNQIEHLERLQWTATSTAMDKVRQAARDHAREAVRTSIESGIATDKVRRLAKP